MIRPAHPFAHVVALVLGLSLCQVAFAGREEDALQQDLDRVEQRIGEAQAELKAALAGYDQKALPEVGSRLRDLKLRREGISRKLTQIREQQRQDENAKLVRERPELARQLELIQPQVREAAAAFAEKPTPSLGARLRELSAQEIELKRKLASAETAATKDAGKPKAAPGGTSPAGTKPR